MALKSRRAPGDEASVGGCATDFTGEPSIIAAAGCKPCSRRVLGNLTSVFGYANNMYLSAAIALGDGSNPLFWMRSFTT